MFKWFWTIPIRFIEIKDKDSEVEGAVQDYFNEYLVVKVWEFEERVEESLRKNPNSSWFAEEPGV